MKIKRALISVSDKENIIDLARFLVQQNIEIISTGGTAKTLRDNDIQVTPISKITGNPEMFGGRMKTISFQVGSSLLFRRENSNDIKDAQELGIEAIDLVVCNLYPFSEIAKNNLNDLPALIENIDIGGPTMIRAAAKNFKHVITLTTPSQYNDFIENFDNLSPEFSFKLAIEAFKLTSQYDQFVQSTLTKHTAEQNSPIALGDMRELRYGENPHQKAWIAPLNNYSQNINLNNAQKLHGKELSFNNMVDADASWKCMSELHHNFPKKITTVIVKHANPCGAAISDNSLESLKQAWDCDPISSFGSIISTNQTINKDYALWLQDKFIEILIAPDFTQDALNILTLKKNIRLLKILPKQKDAHETVYKSINGAMLIQEEDEYLTYEYNSVTKTTIPKNLTTLKSFGMICNKYLKSNSICLVGEKSNSYVLAGTGMGQPNRLDSLKMLAAPRAVARGFNLSELILISDAFFPFRDSIDVANEVGLKFIIQPGGSIRDEEIINACNEFQIAMDFTNTRHFRH